MNITGIEATFFVVNIFALTFAIATLVKYRKVARKRLTLSGLMCRCQNYAFAQLTVYIDPKREPYKHVCPICGETKITFEEENQ